jgi:phage RecT family recombinase
MKTTAARPPDILNSYRRKAVGNDTGMMRQNDLPYMLAIEDARDRFIDITGDAKSWDSECIFAMQLIMKTPFAMKIANDNPSSVMLAMYNAASTGLTLNPANGYAYLVPRGGAIVLDISYKGLIKIATDTGSVEWVRAEVVYEKDSFSYHGPARMPDHACNPFSKDRGEVVGSYCIAKVASGDILTEVMDLAEIHKVRSKSEAFKKQSGPWLEFFVQMCKKANIKRAQHTWPYTEQSGKLADAIQIANASEGGYTFDDAPRNTPGLIAVQNTIPEDSEERAAAVKEAEDVCSLGRDAFLAMWAKWDKPKRKLVNDLVPRFQALAKGADDAKQLAETVIAGEIV